MAISLKATGAWVENVAATPVATLVGSPAAGDRYYIWAAWRDFSITASITGWTEVAEFADGSVSTGNGSGSMKVGCWYRDWQSGDANPTLAFSTATGLLSAYVCQLWQKDPAETWNTPSFVTGTWPSAGGLTQTVSATSTLTVAGGAVVMAELGWSNDTATVTRPTTGLSDAAATVTWNGNYVESPASHFFTTTGNDMDADLGHRFVTTGAAGVTLRQTATIGTAMSGAALWVMQGVTAGLPPVTATDPVGVADSITKDAGKNLTDTVGIVDSMATEFGRAAADGSGITDAAAFSLGFNPAATDLVGLGDSAAATQDWVRSQTDPVGVTDSATVIQDWARTPTDLAGITDSITVGLDLVSNSTDTADITDSADTEQGFNRALADLLGASDSLEVIQDWARSTVDQIGATDVAAFRTDFGNTTSDPVDATDEFEVIADYGQSFIDLADVSDDATFVLAAPGEANADNLIGIGDDLVSVVGANRSDADTVAVTDTLTVGRDVTHSDVVGISDTTGFIADYIRALTNPVGVVDSATFQIEVVPDDSVGVTDSARWDTGLNLGDLVGGTDAAGFATEFVRAFTDPIGVADSATFQLGDNTATTTDPVGLVDAAVFDIFTAPGPDNTWVVRTETVTAALRAETNSVVLAESATVAVRTESTLHSVKAETNLMEV